MLEGFWQPFIFQFKTRSLKFDLAAPLPVSSFSKLYIAFAKSFFFVNLFTITETHAGNENIGREVSKGALLS